MDLKRSSSSNHKNKEFSTFHKTYNHRHYQLAPPTNDNSLNRHGSSTKNLFTTTTTTKLPTISNSFLINQSIPSNGRQKIKQNKHLQFDLHIHRPLSPLPEKMPSPIPTTTHLVVPPERRRSSVKSVTNALLPSDIDENRRRSSVMEGNLRRASRIIDRFEQQELAKELQQQLSTKKRKTKGVYDELKHCRYLRHREEYESSSCPCNKCEKKN